jgi:hypothetical protein
VKPSLLDFAGRRVLTWYVVYRCRPGLRWWSRLQKQGFRHVECWRPYSYGPGVRDVMWLTIHPTFEFLEADIDMDPRAPWERDPTCTVQRVTASRTPMAVRDWWQVGPASCVEYVKAALGIGIAGLFIRTPWQLYKFIARRNEQIHSR